MSLSFDSSDRPIAIGSLPVLLQCEFRPALIRLLSLHLTTRQILGIEPPQCAHAMHASLASDMAVDVFLTEITHQHSAVA